MFTLLPKDKSPILVACNILTSAGFMRKENKTSWLTALHIFSISFIGLESILKVTFGNGKFQNIVDAMSLFTIYIQVNYKLVNMLYRQKDIQNFLERLENVRVGILREDKNRKYLDEADMMGRKCITLVIMLFQSSPFIAFACTSYGAYTSQSEDKRLVLSFWMPWSLENYLIFLITNFNAAIILASGVGVFTVFSVIHITFSFQMTAFLKVLREDLEHKGAEDRNLYEQHKLFTQLINKYNEMFSAQIFMEMMVSSVMPCGFALTTLKTLKKPDASQIDLFHYLILTLASPCIICPCGQLVSTEMVKLQQSSYMSAWYEEKPKVRRDLLILMTTATKPTDLNYRLFVKFDHMCLASVLQGLYSFFMMLINFDTR